MAAKKSKNARQSLTSSTVRATQRATGSRGARVGSLSELPGPSTQTATRRRVSSVSSSWDTRAEQTKPPPREKRVAEMQHQLHRIIHRVGSVNDELETKETEFGALAFIVRAMPKKSKSPTSYEDVFERAKYPAYVTPAQKEFVLAAISTALGRDRKRFDANLRGNQREEFNRIARTFVKYIKTR